MTFHKISQRHPERCKHYLYSSHFQVGSDSILKFACFPNSTECTHHNDELAPTQIVYVGTVKHHNPILVPNMPCIGMMVCLEPKRLCYTIE